VDKCFNTEKQNNCKMTWQRRSYEQNRQN